MGDYGKRYPGAGGATHRPVGGGDAYDGGIEGTDPYHVIGERCWEETEENPRDGIIGKVVDHFTGVRTETVEHCEQTFESRYLSDPSYTKRSK